MTNGEIVSEITNALRALNIDDRISPRYILSVVRDKVALYVKRENERYRLYNYEDIWTTIECIEMEPADKVQCCDIEIPKCRFYMRSVKKLPAMYSFNNGPVVREVISLDDSTEFISSNPRAYRKTLDREFIDKTTKYYWFQNNHLIIPDTQVRSITFTGYFQDPAEAIGIGCGGNNSLNYGDCTNPLDMDFQCPPHLRAIVKQDSLNEIMNSFKRVVVDENPNLSNNIKDQANG